MSWDLIISDIITYGLLSYSFFLLGGYIFIGIYSIGVVKKYRHKNSFTNYRLLAGSTQTPGISVLAPAYNEGANIIENVRSLLSIHYNNMEVIIINDGSKDNSMEKLIKVYDLYKADFFVDQQIATKPVRGVYRSRNFIYSKLIVVDKVNGGKADALNVGVNIASNDYVVCIDVDCILEQDALLKLIKPFLESPVKRVIATGGVVRIANGCEIANGRLIKIHLPDKFLPRVQTLEYIRAFLLGRMAWARLNGLMLISGAFGAFDKEIVIKCGGYDHKTVGEDMELIVRMRRYMEEHNLPYKVAFIPDPLCWTEAPESYKILGRQRNRWTRGTIETLKFHRIMFFNPKYGIMGMFSYPYWFFFEFLAPLVEFGGFLYFLFCVLTGHMDWGFFFSLLALIYTFGVLYSIFAILMEVLSYNQYRSRKDILSLLLTAVVEPILFHPFVVWSAVKGNIDLLRKKNSWGEMTRTGFSPQGQTQPVADAPPSAVDEIPAQTVIAENQPPVFTPYIDTPDTLTPPQPVDGKEEEMEPEIVENTHPPSTGEKWLFLEPLRYFTGIMFIALLFIVAFRLIEIFAIGLSKDLPLDYSRILSWGLWSDLAFWLKIFVPFFIIYILVHLLSTRFARHALKAIIVSFFVVHAGLSIYYNTSLALAGADIFSYSRNDIVQTVGASGDLNFVNVILMLILIIIITIALNFGSRRWKPGQIFSLFITCISVLFTIAGYPEIFNRPAFNSNFESDLAVNKSDYFFKATYSYLLPNTVENDIYAESYIGDYQGDSRSIQFSYVDEQQFPFLHEEAAEDVLSPFFEPQAKAPNIVVILMEGLGRAYSNEGAYLGSFTPFLDSLSGNSLYWENFLSQGGRTFAVLPSLLGSLPFAKNGFLELGEQMPDQLSLLNLLKANGYQTSFHYGGISEFDNMNMYLRKNSVDKILDQNTFPSSYTKLPSVNGFTWGYNDKELFRHYLATNEPLEIKPNFDVILTVSTHNPFVINESEKYVKMFEERLQSLSLTDAEKSRYRNNYRDQFASIIYADDALRGFIKNYSSRPDYANTIFIITGDHRMPEIPMRTKIDRYHVPLVIFSPLLKRTAKISSVSTHFDLAPSILAYLKANHQINLPKQSSWIGQGLDTTRSFQNIHAVPFIQNKSDILDYIMGEYHLNGNDLFKLSSDMNEVLVEDPQMKEQLINAFNQFKKRNSLITGGKKIIPDSIYRKYTSPN